jgi:hypothetical protein
MWTVTEEQGLWVVSDKIHTFCLKVESQAKELTRLLNNLEDEIDFLAEHYVQGIEHND